MRFHIEHQETYSRGELLLRSFFGFIYIILPHLFVLIFVSMWASILSMVAFFAVLFTGRYPQSFFEFQVGLIRWNTRLNARIYNLCDGYPAFGIGSTDPQIDIQVDYPESLSRGLLLLRMFFGAFYVGIPHGFILYFRMIGAMFLQALGFWVILFTGKLPKSWHDFITGTLRWGFRVNLYMSFMTDVYPPFTGRELEEEKAPATRPSSPAPEAPAEGSDSQDEN